MLKYWSSFSIGLKYQQAAIKRISLPQNKKPINLKQFFLHQVPHSFYSTSRNQEPTIQKQLLSESKPNSKNLQDFQHQQVDQLTFQNYAFRKLSKAYQKEALELIVSQFNAQQPLTNAFFRKFPEEPEHRYKKWKDFWGLWMENSCSNNISVAVHDLNSNNQLIGVLLAKDLLFEPENLSQQYLQNLNFISSVIQLELKLIQQIDPSIKSEFSKAHNVADLWASSIQKKHQGKNILSKMIEVSVQLAKKQGYHYSFAYATNFKAQKCLKKQNFQMISKINAKQAKSFGCLPFELIEQEQKYTQIWFKSLI